MPSSAHLRSLDADWRKRGSHIDSRPAAQWRGTAGGRDAASILARIFTRFLTKIYNAFLEDVSSYCIPLIVVVSNKDIFGVRTDVHCYKIYSFNMS